MIEEFVNKIESKQPVGETLFNQVIEKYTNGEFTDTQFLPVVRAIYLHGLCDQDLYFLTQAMTRSGKVLDLSSLGKVIDKHSTGGVSDTTTLVVVPICASLNVTMFKMSGRALGFTGGTCDKLECFEGYNTDIELDSALKLAKQNGACMLTSSEEIAPADKKIYALRDKTGLVDNIPLIASSIMSKKLASGADMILLDVKYGNGAFMPTKLQAKKLASKMKKIGTLHGKKVKIVYGNMNQPLGNNIGPRLESFEAIQVLKGEKNSLYYDCAKLASKCVAMYKHIPYFLAKRQVVNAIKSGQALEKFKVLIQSQHGSLKLFDECMPQSSLKIYAQKNGKFYYTSTKRLGMIASSLVNACGHEFSKQNFVGITTNFKNGQKVHKADCIFEIYAPDDKIPADIEAQLADCFVIKQK